MNTYPYHILKTFIPFLSLWNHNISFAQEVHTYNASGARCYSNTLFIDTAKNPKGVLVIDVQDNDIKSYAHSNPLTASGLFKQYNFLFIKILDEQSKKSKSCYQTITNVISYVHHIRKEAFYYINERELENKDNGFSMSYDRKNQVINASIDSVLKIKDELERMAEGKLYVLPVALSVAQEDSIKLNTYKGNFDVGINYTPTFLLGNKFGIKTNFIGVFGLALKKNIKSNAALLFNFNYSKANKTKLQEKVIDAGKKDTINSHALIGAELVFRKYIRQERQFRIFASGGVGIYSIYDIDLKKRSTSVSVKSYESQYITPLLEGGFEYRITPVISVNGFIPVKYFISTKNKNTLSLGLNLGVSFTLNTPKAIRKKIPNEDVQK